MKTIAQFPFQELNSIPKIVKDFLSGRLGFAQSYTWNPNNIQQKIVEKQQNYSTAIRNSLAKVVAEQHQNLQLTEAQANNLNALFQENTFTITTGHQLNLFSGPVFFIYKILQVIKSADELNKQKKGYHFVPIFWMATEDHDFEEINHFKTTQSRFEIKAKSGTAVGRIPLLDLDFVADFEKEFKGTRFGDELINLLKFSYKKGETLAEATRKLVHSLFADYGLIIVDGDDQRLKQWMIPCFREELLSQELYKNSQAKVDQLTTSYGKVQVNPREINLFYLKETRNRIVFRDGKYFVLETDIVFTADEIFIELEKYPERFSPNALLRPVYQESILPNIAYIGGNAEVAYWLELTDYFKSISLCYPILVPRNSMLFISDKQLSKLEGLKLSPNDIFEDEKSILSNVLLTNHRLNDLLEEKEEELNTIFSVLKSNAITTDKSFEQLLQAEETRQLKSYDRMRKRLLKAEKIKQTEKVERIKSLFSTLHPNGIWQERQWNFSVFYADFGKEWIRNCYGIMQIDRSEMIVIAHSF